MSMVFFYCRFNKKHTVNERKTKRTAVSVIVKLNADGSMLPMKVLYEGCEFLADKATIIHSMRNNTDLNYRISVAGIET